MSYCTWFCMQASHLWVFWARWKYAGVNSIGRGRKTAYRTSKMSAGMSALESAALRLPCTPRSLLFTSPCPPVQTIVPSFLFLQGDVLDMPPAKRNLFCTSSMRHVVSLGCTSIKCDPDEDTYRPTVLQCLRSLHKSQESVQFRGSFIMSCLRDLLAWMVPWSFFLQNK